MSSPAPLPIGEVARRTGFSPDTLRYYERLRLVPPPARNGSGRRAYDDRSIERLRFIDRAKQLGCSLDEIARLLAPYDDDCGGVQTQLRELLSAKIVAADARLAAVATLGEQLRDARHRLSPAAASGPCGSNCACLGGTAADRSAGATATIAGAYAASDAAPAIACSLDEQAMGERVAEWEALATAALRREPIDGGARLTLAPDANLAAVAGLVRSELECCPFFRFALTIDGRGTALEVRAPEGATGLAALLVGDAA